MSNVSVTATLSSIRMSPRKVGVVASLVRGRSASDAATILDHTPRHAAKPLAKLLASAVANAENNQNAKTDSLQISRLEVGFAQRGKRFRPAAHGRALPYQLKYSRITIELSGEAKVKKLKKANAKKAEDTGAKAEDNKTTKTEKESA